MYPSLPFLRCTFVVVYLSVLGILYWQPSHAQTPVPAQVQCLELIEQLKVAIADCNDINSNFACYGSVEADVLPIEYRFQGLRDRRPLSQLNDIDTNDDGVVFMNLQIEGVTDSVRTMMFGNGKLNPADGTDGSYLMQIDNPTELCTLTPPGLVLNTETGQSGEITINGVLVELRSTAFTTVEADGLMTIVNLEGQVAVTINGVTQILPVGYQTRISFVGGTPQFAISTPVPSLYARSVLLRWTTDNPTEGIRSIRNTNTNPNLNCVRDVEFGVPLVNQLISNPGHECLYRFCTDSGESFSIGMETASGNLDSWIDLRGEDGQLLAFNNDVDGEDADSAMCNVGLPEPACYTIVARANNNQTNGYFNLSLNSGSEQCVEPEPRCRVVTHTRPELREGPGTTFPALQGLSRNTELLPLGYSQDSQWVKVQVQGQAEATEGWVRDAPEFVQCEIQTIEKVKTVVLEPETPEPTPTGTIQVEPTQVEPTIAQEPTSVATVLPTSTPTPVFTVAPAFTPSFTPTFTPTALNCAEAIGLVVSEECRDKVTPLPTGDEPPTPKPEETKIDCDKCDPFGTP